MDYIGEDELTQMMGIGQLGEIRRGPDGDMYQWVEGVDGLGNLTGFWSKIKKGVKRIAKTVSKYATKPYCIPLQAIPGPVKGIAKKVCRVVGQLSPLAHVPVVGSYYRGAAKLCKIAKDCGIAGLEGGLMQAPDGTVYEVQGLGGGEILFGQSEGEVLYGLGQEDLTAMMGIGQLGELRRGPDGEVYRWVEGLDGLGRRVRFWRCKGCIDASKRIARSKQRQRMIRQSGASRPAAAPMQAAPAAVSGIGEIYQAQDGTVYGMSGFADDQDLYGLGDEHELYGLSDDEELYGLADEDDLTGMEEGELYGLEEDEDLYGLAEDEELYGLADDEELYGVDGYITDPNKTFGAYVPDRPAGTRMFVPPAQAPEIWKTLW